jgi:hypothetical protein
VVPGTEPEGFVGEEHLDFSHFHCCGDEDLYPCKCSECGLPLVFCYECGTLYYALPDTTQSRHDLNHFDPSKPSHHCPRCRHAFEYKFMKNRSYRVTRAEWRSAGLDGLLDPKERS